MGHGVGVVRKAVGLGTRPVNRVFTPSPSQLGGIERHDADQSRNCVATATQFADQSRNCVAVALPFVSGCLFNRRWWPLLPLLETDMPPLSRRQPRPSRTCDEARDGQG